MALKEEETAVAKTSTPTVWSRSRAACYTQRSSIWLLLLACSGEKHYYSQSIPRVFL